MELGNRFDSVFHFFLNRRQDSKIIILNVPEVRQFASVYANNFFKRMLCMSFPRVHHIFFCQLSALLLHNFLQQTTKLALVGELFPCYANPMSYLAEDHIQ